MAIKRMTIRLSPELHQRLVHLSAGQDKSLNTLAVEALESYAGQAGRIPLQQMSELLAPAAEAGNMEEAELLAYARSVRQQIWQERYEKVIREIES